MSKVNIIIFSIHICELRLVITLPDACICTITVSNATVSHGR